jgi:transmembrane sensor
VERVSQDAIDVNLHRGRSNFRVTPDHARVFTVRAGDVMVTVLGTEFTVEKRGERTYVRVTRGKVSVDWPGGNRLLLAGDEGQFPPEEPKQLTDLPRAPPVAPPALGVNLPKAAAEEARPAIEEYRDRAAQQDFDKAYQVMLATPKVVGSDVSDLMLAADVARLSGHPAEAVPYLRRVLGEHSGDSRAPSAAFTLGRMYLGQLGSPGEAAAAFAKVRALAPVGPLAEDALAREVEARARAGEKATAQSLARQYLERYPNGRRTAVVRAQAGLDSSSAQ